MNPRERGFLLLTSHLGNPERKVLTPPQLRVLARRVRGMEAPMEDRELDARDLAALGYGPDMAGRILALLAEEENLEWYLRRGERLHCVPITRVSGEYPKQLRQRLGQDSPGCLWAKGDIGLLTTPMVALVGSRDLAEPNREFATEVGRQAARQGFTLVSGNARGADRTAQESCLGAGGRVISVVADPLADHAVRDNILYLSEDGFEEVFSSQRALSRNRCIHALGEKVFVAQSGYRQGGTWDGTVKNLRNRWSGVYCFADGSPVVALLTEMGGQTVTVRDLRDLSKLQDCQQNLFDTTI